MYGGEGKAWRENHFFLKMRYLNIDGVMELCSAYYRVVREIFKFPFCEMMLPCKFEPSSFLPSFTACFLHGGTLAPSPKRARKGEEAAFLVQTIREGAWVKYVGAFFPKRRLSKKIQA